MTTSSTGARGIRDRHAQLALLVVVLGVAAWAAAVVLGLRRPDGMEPLRPVDLLWAGSFSAFLGLGAFIARRRPHNPVGWCLAAGPVCVGAGVALFEYVGDVSRPAAEWVGLAADPIFGFGILLLGLWWLWYPDGGLVSDRWRWVVRAAAVLYGLSVVVHVVSPTPYSDAVPTRSPLALEASLLEPLRAVTGMAPVLIFAASFASLVVRFRNGDTRTRSQLKIVVYAVVLVAGVAGVLTGVTAFTGPNPLLDGLGFGITVAALLSIPTAVAIAIVRHRAFDIDRAISRTLAYALMTAIAIAVYSASVVAFGAVARTAAGRSSDLVVALSTLVVAALFQPLRRRVQRVVDRRFNRGHIDGLVAAEEFGRRLREEVELGTVVADLRRTVTRTLQPATTSVITVSAGGEGS